MRRLALAIPMLLAAALAGCSSPCQDLGTRICKCTPEGSSRESCERAVEEQVEDGNPNPDGDDQDFCEEKLRSCADPDDDPAMCDRLVTEQGKQACGLAY